MMGGSRRPLFRDGRACGSKDLQDWPRAPGGGDGALSIQLSISASNILRQAAATDRCLRTGLFVKCTSCKASTHFTLQFFRCCAKVCLSGPEAVTFCLP